MGAKTGISWTDSTWNCLRGCTRVSDGCRFCYAESIAYRFKGEGQPYEGLAVLKNGHASWTGKVDWIDAHWEDPLRWSQIIEHQGGCDGKGLHRRLCTCPRRGHRIFVNSMSDLFHEAVPDLWIDKMMAVMQHCQSKGHIFQILTKRPQRMYDYFNNPDLYLRLMASVNVVRGRWPKIPVVPLSDPKRFPLKNVWLGVSAENQKTADERIPLLVGTPTAVRFVSAEPLLGPIDFEYPKTLFPDGPAMCCNGWECGCQGRPLDPPLIYGINQIIVGGESGPRARPMASSWAEDIREQCARWNVKYFFKQNGEFIDAGHEDFGRLPSSPIVHMRSDGSLWPKDGVPTDEDADVNTMKRVGRKRAGDTLYGKVYHEFPEVR